MILLRGAVMPFSKLQVVSLRVWFVVLATGAFAFVIAGLVIQDMYRLSPCPLCIFQRLLYVLIGLIAVLGAALPIASRLCAALLALTGLGGIATAGYQTWMQAFPHLANECSYTDPNLIERFVDWLGMQWPTLFLATGFCASRDWEFLGLSIANWSLVAFAGFAVAAVLLLRKKS